MAVLSVDRSNWDQIYQNYNDFSTPYQSFNVGLREGLKKFDQSKFQWTAFDKSNTDTEESLSHLTDYLNETNQEALSVDQLLIAPIENAVDGFKHSLSSIVNILDSLAGNNTEATAADNLVSSITNVCNALTACVAPVTQLGFPEIPLLGNLGEFLTMLTQKDQIMRQLPPSLRAEIEQQLKKEKEGKSASEWAMECFEQIAGTGWGNLLQSAYQDIIKIMANLPFLPITILFSAISVLIDAVSQLFNAVGLGTFDFDGMVKGKKLDFSMDISSPDFSFDPPGNIFEALGKSIPLICSSIVALPQMIINGTMENLWLCTTGIGSLFNSTTYTSNKVLRKAIQDGSWADFLKKENAELETQILDLQSQISKLQSPISSQSQIYKDPNNPEIKKLFDQISIKQARVKSNEEKIKELEKAKETIPPKPTEKPESEKSES